MSMLNRFFHFLTMSSEQRDREYADAYLSNATDIYDLEHRMRELNNEGLYR